MSLPIKLLSAECSALRISVAISAISGTVSCSSAGRHCRLETVLTAALFQTRILILTGETQFGPQHHSQAYRAANRMMNASKPAMLCLSTRHGLAYASTLNSLPCTRG